MNFADAAAQLCGQCALVLGWRPGEFWGATPAELGCVLTAVAAQSEAPPEASTLKNLMEQFPDATSGGH